MAKGKKTGGKDFKPGYAGGPGRPPLLPEVKILRRITMQDVAEIGQMIVMGDVVALQQVVNNAQHKDPSMRATVLQVLFARAAMVAIEEGDVFKLNALLDRLIGRIPAPIIVANMNQDEAPRGSEAKTIVFETVERPVNAIEN